MSQWSNTLENMVLSNIYTTSPSGLDSKCGPSALVWDTLSRQSPIKEPLPKIQGPIWGLEGSVVMDFVSKLPHDITYSVQYMLIILFYLF